jgi:hypothetical protein
MLGIEIESPQPDDLAAHWSRILETPITLDHGLATMRLEQNTIQFLEGRVEVLSAIRVQVKDLGTTIERALSCGLRVEQGSFHLGGVNFRLSV